MQSKMKPEGKLVGVVSTAEGTTATISGMMTHKTYDALWAALSAIKPNSKSLSVDCTAVQEVDSSAVALLLALQRQLKAADKRLIITSPPTSLKQLVSLYGLCA